MIFISLILIVDKHFDSLWCGAYDEKHFYGMVRMSFTAGLTLHYLKWLIISLLVMLSKMVDC